MHIRTLWSNALKSAKEGNFNKDTLNHVGNTIRKTTRWSDPLDCLFIHNIASVKSAHAMSTWLFHILIN
jgi:hypothetical protein